MLIVCPACLRQQWSREIRKFAGQEAQAIQGPAASRSTQFRRGRGFYVINYELALRDVSVINETPRPDLLILNEEQRIRNWRTKIASAIKSIPARYAFVLGGTPLAEDLAGGGPGEKSAIAKTAAEGVETSLCQRSRRPFNLRLSRISCATPGTSHVAPRP